MAEAQAKRDIGTSEGNQHANNGTSRRSLIRSLCIQRTDSAVAVEHDEGRELSDVRLDVRLLADLLPTY